MLAISAQDASRNPLYGFLKATDKETKITVITGSSPELLSQLQQKVTALNLFSSYIEFSYEPTDILPTPVTADSAVKIPLNPEQLNQDKKIWSVATCKLATRLLYAKAKEDNLPTPYPLFSAIYKGWAEDNLSAELKKNGELLKTTLKTLGEISKESALMELSSFLEKTKVDPETLKSVNNYIDLRYQQVQLPKEMEGIALEPKKEKVDAFSYIEWAAKQEFTEENKKTSELICLELEKITAETSLNEAISGINSILKAKAIEDNIIKSIALHLNNLFPEESLENIQDLISNHIFELANKEPAGSSCIVM